MPVNHANVDTLPDNPAFQNSSNEWNANHVVSGVDEHAMSIVHENDTNILVKYDPMTYAGVEGFTTTEAQAQLKVTNSKTITRLRARVGTNTKNANMIIGVRDDGVTVASLTIASGFTGEADSGALNITIAGGSEVNWIIDNSAQASGASSYHARAELERVAS